VGDCTAASNCGSSAGSEAISKARTIPVRAAPGAAGSRASNRPRNLVPAWSEARARRRQPEPNRQLHRPRRRARATAWPRFLPQRQAIHMSQHRFLRAISQLCQCVMGRGQRAIPAFKIERRLVQMLLHNVRNGCPGKLASGLRSSVPPSWLGFRVVDQDALQELHVRRQSGTMHET